MDLDWRTSMQEREAVNNGDITEPQLAEQAPERVTASPIDRSFSHDEVQPDSALPEEALPEETLPGEAPPEETLPEEVSPQKSKDGAPPAGGATTHRANGSVDAGEEIDDERIAALLLDLQNVERLLLDELRSRVQPEQFETWLRRTAVVSVSRETLNLAVQNNFSRDWLRSYYQDVLQAAVRAVVLPTTEIELSVDPELTTRAEALHRTTAAADDSAADGSTTGRGTGSSAANGRGSRSADQAAGNDSRNRHPGAGATAPRKRPSTRETYASDIGPTGLLYDSDIGLNDKYTFDNFVVGPCNRFAHAAAVGAAESPGKAYNPFFLHGNVGLGKTHLLQSMCASLLHRRNDTRILFLSCETFVNHFINALENGDIEKFRTKYRNVDVLVVDDIHLLANKERTQEEFFHTFNSLYNAGKQIVLSSDSPPKDIPTLQDRLVSRFKWGLVTEIEPPCYETRMAILIRKSRERGREIPEEVARLLAEHIDTNIRELEGAVTRLIGYAGLSGQSITPDLARDVLRDVFQVRKGAPTMDEIIRVVIEHFNVKLPELQSRKRTNAIAFPRQIAMYLARKITRHSLEEIGGFLGGRDHSTVLYAVEKISKLSESDDECRQLLGTFLERLQVQRS